MNSNIPCPYKNSPQERQANSVDDIFTIIKMILYLDIIHNNESNEEICSTLLEWEKKCNLLEWENVIDSTISCKKKKNHYKKSPKMVWRKKK